MPLPRRAGVTLVELLVVLVILGISGGLVLPAIQQWRGAENTTTDPMVEARRLASRRGESMRVTIDADGRWAATAERDTTDAPLAKGTTQTAPIGTWVVTPVGLCLPVAGTTTTRATAWDPVRCAPLAREPGAGA